ncbi:MAG TPA: VanZ family protein [Steroidobacteraceae bacterium]|nr:VanZ family protein [Steroidobacteraceae bacterium]
MVRTGHSSLMPLLIIGVMAFIAFGSLYPFRLNGAEPALLDALHRLSWAHAGRDDLIRNVLMYLPLGFCLLLWFRRYLNTWWSLLLSCVTGAALSLCIEVAQVYFTRVPSYMDITLNAIGTLLGAAIGLSWNSMTQWIALPENIRSQSRDRNALLLVLLWIIWRMVDISLHISLGRLKMALHPLLHIEIFWLLVLRYLVSWLTVSLAVLAYSSRQRANEALLGVIGVVLVGRILFVSPAFDSSELLALILLLPALVLVHTARWLPAAVIVLCAWSCIYVYDHVLPLDMSTFHWSFDLLPFVEWIRNGATFNLNTLLHMLFVFAAMIWLLKESGLSLRSATIIVVIAMLGIEIFHMWQADRSGSLTRPVLALAMGLLMMAIDRNASTSRKSA